MILSTKLHIPHARGSLVARPRLMRMLNEGMHAKLTLLSAQAGYGKTTALTEWVKQCGSMAAWVSLDRQDDDLFQFWKYVIASIQERVPSFGAKLRSLLDTGVSWEPLVTALVNELNHMAGELVIILDDFHVIDLPEIHQSLSYLLDYLPPHVHLYIASRTDMDIPTARLMAKGEFHRILMQDLRFQLDEGFVFFRNMTDLPLTQEQVTRLCHYTEGWVSGLQLAAISLKRSGNIAESIQQFSGRQQHISDYLLEEVFQNQPEPIRAFLLKTSILSRMNHSLCQAVTGEMNSQELLERVEQLNLFLIPLDEHRHWYRFHHLLSDFLQQKYLRTDPDTWVKVHVRAANWLENHGFDEEAVEHYVEGKQSQDAVRLIEKNLHTLVQTKSVVLMRWVSVLPEDSFAEKPMIELFYISVLLGVGEWDAAFTRVERALPRFRALRGKCTDAEWNQAMGNIYFFCAITSYLQKDLVRTSNYFELMDQHMPEGSFFQTVGRNRYQGYDSFDDFLVHIHDLKAADAILLTWIQRWEGKRNYPFLGFLYASYSKLLYEWNRLDEAEFYVKLALEREDVRPFSRIMMQIAFSASRIQQAQGNTDRASLLMEQLKSQIDSPDRALFMQKIEAEQAVLSLKQGFLAKAQDWLQRCGLAHTDEVTLHRAAEYMALARVLAASEQEEDALPVLERLYCLYDKDDRLRDRIQVLLLQSVTLQRLGRTEAALQTLEIALQMAEPQGYIRSFTDEGSVMDQLLSAFWQGSRIQSRSSVSPDYVKNLLQAFRLASEEERAGKDLLTEQETKVLLLTADGLSNKEIALHLYITSETVKFHLKNVYRKMNVKNRVQALQRAKEFRIIT
ncbi:LuxR C-terminal-related transcriptional regulator [Paenibacillus gansuensis]|uniref:LuxR C-terminal-related transcriptional regulator n=1 Tax=Paenibacillus gansuensis TaxID=306542 RepID=A0ABW5PGK3_9BACL